MTEKIVSVLWKIENALDAVPPRIMAILAGMIVLHLLQIYHLLPRPSL